MKSTTQWFGMPWPSVDMPAPVCSDPSMRVPTPIGKWCMWCICSIEDGDRGIVIPHLGPERASSVFHLECFLSSVLGLTKAPQ